MLHRRFGRTNLQMPVFSCGGMRYQHAWADLDDKTIPADNQANLEAVIRRAVEVGVNHIETARDYGTSELQLGKILPGFPRDRIIVQTKVPPAAKADDFLRGFDRSMSLLKLDHVELLAIHGINNEETYERSMRPGGCIEAAEKIRASGRAKFIGFSTHGPSDIIARAIETNAFDYVNLHWYYIFQNNWSCVEAATARDMGVFIISPSDKGGMLYNPPEKLVKLCEPLSPMVFNDLFCLSHPQVHTLSVGAARPSDFDEHLKTLPLLEKAGEILPPIVERLERAMDEAVGENWRRTWNQGLPRFDETPGNINIPVILWLRNLVLAYDLTEYARMRYNLLGNGGHWFPGLKAEGVDKLDLRECLKASPHRDRIPALLAEIHEILNAGEVKRLSAG